MLKETSGKLVVLKEKFGNLQQNIKNALLKFDFWKEWILSNIDQNLFVTITLLIISMAFCFI